MTTITAALTKEQGVTFVAVLAQDSVLHSPTQAGDLMHEIERRFRCPPVLIGEHSHEILGRHDLARFIKSVGIGSLPWRKWTAT